MTSSFAADANDKMPTGVCVIFRSCTIRARTGNAVMLIDIPKNRAKGRKSVCAAAYSSYTQKDDTIPKKKGITIPA